MTAAGRLERDKPEAYATGEAAFRLLELAVDERVLIPRPETEVLVDLALQMTDGGRGTAVDVGTGSGAIALSLAVEGAFERVIATDISRGALAVAQANAERVRRVFNEKGARVAELEFREGSWLAPCAGERAELVVSNPPYIAHSEAAELPAAVRDWEPPLALFAGGEGLDPILAVAQGAAPILTPGGVLVIEVDSRRAGRSAEAVESVGAYEGLQVRPDLTGRARFVVARRRREV